jgi:hypothetical protein
VGVGHVQYLPKYYSPEKIAELEAGYPSVRINYFSHDKKSNGFVPTGLNCTEQSKNTLGPEVGMAEYLHGRYPDEEFFIVKCAVGGVSMWRDWLSPSGGEAYDPTARALSPEQAVYAVDNGLPMPTGWCYNELIALLRESLAELEEQGYTPVIRGFCWMQGEADACAAETMAPYGERYDGLRRDLLAAFPETMADCVFADGGISTVWPFYREMNACKEAYAATHGGCVFIDTVAAGLTTDREPAGAVDHYHYDSDATVKLGRLFAEAVMGA